jgi:hypothetical protein
MFEKSSTGNNDEISVTQWDARLDNAFEMIDKMVEMILFTTQDKSGTGRVHERRSR